MHGCFCFALVCVSIHGMIESSPPQSPGEVSPEQPLAILCVDDEEDILKSLTRLFRKEPFQVLTATSGKEALAILKDTKNVGLILSDHRMPEMTGPNFLHAAAMLAPDSTRMILTGHADTDAAIEAINRGGASRFLTKPWDDHELLQAVRDGLRRYELRQQKHHLYTLVIRQKDELAEWNTNLKNRVLHQAATIRKQLEETHKLADHDHRYCNVILSLLTDLQNQRHHRLSRHSRNVAALAASMVKTLGLPHAEEIRQAALLHDIGLIGVPDRLLGNNNTELLRYVDVTEYRAHPIKGQETVAIIEELQSIGRLIRHHHEEFDGSGFPDGLAGADIPMGARIIHLASFIENNYTMLPGKDVKYQVSRKMATGMGTLFDPALHAAANLALTEVLDS